MSRVLAADVTRCTGEGCAARLTCRRAEVLSPRVKNPVPRMNPPGTDRSCSHYMPIDGPVVSNIHGIEHPAVLVGERPTRSWDGDQRSILTQGAFWRLAQWLFPGRPADSINNYLRTFTRVNAIQQPDGRPTKVERAAAGMAIRCLAGQRPVVVCGRVAARVLGLSVTAEVPRIEGQFVVIPHPTALARPWHDHTIRQKSVQMVRQVLGLPA